MRLEELHLKNLLDDYFENQKNQSYYLFLKDVDSYVKKVLFKKVYNPELLEDTSQEIILGIHKSLSTFDRSKSILPWINSIIFHKTIDFYRKQKHFSGHEAIENHEIEKNEISLDDRLVFGEVISYLSKEVFGSNYIEQKLLGKSIEEISVDMGLSKSNTKVIFHRLTKKLKEDLS